MKRYIDESARRIPVVGSYDIIVIGGGIAGVAAAVSAARAGARVALVEKEYSLGGLATLANVVVYLPLCDGRGHQVIRSLGEELLELSVRDRPDAIPPCWRPGGDLAERLRRRYRVDFNPASYMIALDELLVATGVALHYDTRFCDIHKKGRRIDAVIVENKDGRTALRARAVVDASGDADVCARSGEETVSLATNSLSGWFFYRAGSDIRFSKLSRRFDPPGEAISNEPRYAGDKADDVTRNMIDARRFIREKLDAIAAEMGAPVEPLVLPTIPSLRMTRRLKGAVELDEADERKPFADSIGMTGDWRQAGPVYYIPLRTLTGVRTDNLITAGRCISARTAWDVTRAIPTCAVTGEAAGAAAALLAANNLRRFADLDVALLQSHLRRRGVPLLKRIAEEKTT